MTHSSAIVGSSWLLGLMLALAIGVTPARAADIDVAVKNPRAYGHVVGDRLTRGVRFTLPDGYRLERTSLPGQGKLNYWLDLVALAFDAPDERGGRVEATFVYQLFYAPLQAGRRELPSFTVRAVGPDDDVIEARVPGFAFTMSPLIELQSEAEFGSQDNGIMLPDERPGLRDVAAPRRTALISVVIAWVAVLAWAWISDRLPGYKRGPFALAAARLKRLRRGTEPATPSALRVLHRAFDATAGRAVFAEDLDGFVAAHPAFADLRDEIDTFFAFSRRFFFVGVESNGDRRHTLTELQRLAEQCRRREARA